MSFSNSEGRLVKLSEQYVANELTHLVGRTHVKDLEKQYSTLKNILTEQKMYATHRSLGGLVSYGNDEASGFKGPAVIVTEGATMRKKEDELQVSGFTVVDLGQPLEKRYASSAICFCDIPISCLGIHMKKYGFFGLSFAKEFLIQKGASPVFYVSSNSPVYAHDAKSSEPHIVSNLHDCFESKTLLCDSLMRQMRVENAGVGEIQDFLIAKIFAFIKPFDAGRSADDEQNYYMEREWRTVTEFSFESADVCRIVLPSSYAERFSRDFPDYVARMRYAEDIPGAKEILEQLGHSG